MPHTTTIEALIIFFVSQLALLGVEYYLLVLVDATWLAEAHRSIRLGSELILAAGPLLRAIAGLTYIALVRLLKKLSPSVQKNSSVPQWVTVVVGTMMVVATYTLWTMTSFEPYVIYWLYPTSLMVVLATVPILAFAIGRVSGSYEERSERRKLENEHSIHIKTRRGYINVPNPYRGSLVIGSSGSGKSASIGNAFLHQFVQKGFCGVFTT